MKKQLLISIAILSLLIIGTILVVLYGEGYRFWFEKGKPDISGTGLLVVTSKPDGAQVFINDHLTTATNSTINLSPGSYSVRIYKDGYFSWAKQVDMQKEVVQKLDATLFPTAPKLESITTSGVQNPTIDPSLTEIAYTVSSSSAKKNGMYVLDLGSRSFLTLQSNATQIADETTDVFSKAMLTWSPDSKQILASISAQTRNPTWYILRTTSFTDNPQDVTTTLDSLLSSWDTQKKEKETTREQGLPKTLQTIVQQNFSHIIWSPDETKILYVASQSATILPIIKPALIGTNQTPEERTIKKDAVYVYDIKEDKNYKIPNLVCHPERSEGSFSSIVERDSSATPQNDKQCNPLSWYFDSKHLVSVKNKKIDILDYDGKNITTVYAGPFVDNYVFPFPNASKIVILTNLGNPDSSPNLYTLGLE